MKKLLFLGSILFVMVFTFAMMNKPTSRYQPAQSQGITNTTEYPSATHTPQPTSTLIPSATIDYQQTAIVAQATADEARRINAIATTEYLALINQQLAMTQVVEQQNFMIQSWTATAALTTIPLTATQQAVMNTQIPQQQAIIAGQMTATKEAPTQVQAMLNLEYDKKYGGASHVASIAAMWAVVILSIGFIVFLIFKWRLEDRKEKRLQLQQPTQRPVQNSTGLVDMHKQDHGQGMFTMRKKNEVPCTPEQLTELSELVVNGERTFGINRLENTSRTLRRDALYQMREFYCSNNLAVGAGAGQISLNDAGREFHMYWFDNHTLPTEYKFASPSPDIDTPLDHAEIMENSIMPHENHDDLPVGEGAYPVLAVDN